METEASTDTLANRLAEVKDEKVNETLTDVNGASLVQTLAGTMAEVEAKTVGYTLGDVEAEALVDTLP